MALHESHRHGHQARPLSHNNHRPRHHIPRQDPLLNEAAQHTSLNDTIDDTDCVSVPCNLKMNFAARILHRLPIIILFAATSCKSNTSNGDDESLKKQVAVYESKITSATVDGCIELREAWIPTDSDLEAIYGENAKFAIAKRDANEKKNKPTPERLREIVEENQKNGPIDEDKFTIEVKPHDDFHVITAQKEGLLNEGFPIRKYSVQSRDSLSGSGSVIHVNGRWVNFIPIDNLYIQLGR